jgi:hypothetical protein
MKIRPMKLPVLALIPILIMVQASYFDTQGTITDVLAPNSLKINDKIINLEGVNPTGLNRIQYVILMNNLRDWLIGKDAFLSKETTCTSICTAYNSVSINEMVQTISRILKITSEITYRY